MRSMGPNRWLLGQHWCPLEPFAAAGPIAVGIAAGPEPVPETGLMESCVVWDADAAAGDVMPPHGAVMELGVASSGTLMPPQGVVMPPLGDVMELGAVSSGTRRTNRVCRHRHVSQSPNVGRSTNSSNC